MREKTKMKKEPQRGSTKIQPLRGYSIFSAIHHRISYGVIQIEPLRGFSPLRVFEKTSANTRLLRPDELNIFAFSVCRPYNDEDSGALVIYHSLESSSLRGCRQEFSNEQFVSGKPKQSEKK